MEKTINQRMFNVQTKIGKISKGKENPFFKSKYADINDILDVLKPLLEEEELVVTQPLSMEEDRPVIRTIISSLDVKENPIISTMPLPEIQDPQKMGSAITYYRRYSLQSLFLMQAEDDDGNKASGKTTYKVKNDSRPTQTKNIQNPNVEVPF